MSPGATHPLETSARILDVAERLIQTRGFNGFSYADVGAELELTNASVHYHYPTKSALGEALIARYTDHFMVELDAVRQRFHHAPARLSAYAELYAAALRGDRMCLCGMLAAEIETLSQAMQQAIVRFFDVNEDWLECVLREGEERGEFALAGAARDEARLFLSGLEGAMLVARPYGQPERFATAADRLVATVTARPVRR